MSSYTVSYPVCFLHYCVTLFGVCGNGVVVAVFSTVNEWPTDQFWYTNSLHKHINILHTLSTQSNQGCSATENINAANIWQSLEHFIVSEKDTAWEIPFGNFGELPTEAGGLTVAARHIFSDH